MCTLGGWEDSHVTSEYGCTASKLEDGADSGNVKPTAGLRHSSGVFCRAFSFLARRWNWTCVSTRSSALWKMKALGFDVEWPQHCSTSWRHWWRNTLCDELLRMNTFTCGGVLHEDRPRCRNTAARNETYHPVLRYFQRSKRMFHLCTRGLTKGISSANSHHGNDLLRCRVIDKWCFAALMIVKDSKRRSIFKSPLIRVVRERLAVLSRGARGSPRRKNTLRGTSTW